MLASRRQVLVGGIVSEMDIMNLCMVPGPQGESQPQAHSFVVAAGGYSRLSRNFILVLGHVVVICGYATNLPLCWGVLYEA
jgi:hypothetical protein